MEYSEGKKLLAEALGTFIFFVLGAGAAIAGQIPVGGSPGTLTVALGHGIGLALAVTAFGRISGAHVNPAVTAGLWAGGKIPAGTAVNYVLAQLAGGVAAGVALRGMFPAHVWQAADYAVPSLGLEVGPMAGIGVEALLTFFLVLMVYATAVDVKAPSVAGFGIGLTVFCDILVGAPLTGACMNPARAFGPAVAAFSREAWAAHYVYWIGPLLGGIAAGLLYTQVWMTRDTR